MAQFGLNKANVKDKVRQTGPQAMTLETDRACAPNLVYNCLTASVSSVVDKKLLLGNEQNGDIGAAWLKTNYAGSGPLRMRE